MNRPCANSPEFADDEKNDYVLKQMPDYSNPNLGGTMRLGSKETKLEENSLIWKLYGKQTVIHERHRHRYEVNLDNIHQTMIPLFVGKGDNGSRMEALELSYHKFFIGVQFHPEFKSRPQYPSPLFIGLIGATL